MLFIIMAIEDLECHQINVNNAFIESVNTEVIYMSLLKGILISKGTTLHVLKSLYGLKQAVRG